MTNSEQKSDARKDYLETMVHRKQVEEKETGNVYYAPFKTYWDDFVSEPEMGCSTDVYHFV